MHDRTVFQITCIGGEEFRGKVVRAFDHEVDTSNELSGIFGQKALAQQHEPSARPGCARLEREPSYVQLVLTDISVAIEDLTVEVAFIYGIVVTQHELANASADEG
jgi:hypothetical protein